MKQLSEEQRKKIARQLVTAMDAGLSQPTREDRMWTQAMCSVRAIESVFAAMSETEEADKEPLTFAAAMDEPGWSESQAELASLKSALAAKEQELAEANNLRQIAEDNLRKADDRTARAESDRDAGLRTLVQVRQELADTIAAVNEFGGNIDYSKFGKPRFWHGNSSVDYPTYTEACLAAWRARGPGDGLP